MRLMRVLLFERTRNLVELGWNDRASSIKNFGNVYRAERREREERTAEAPLWDDVQITGDPSAKW